jgi:hypothetical protein
MKKTLISLMLFLVSCQSPKPFQPSFEFLENDKKEIKACLGEKDLKELKKKLLSCE